MLGFLKTENRFDIFFEMKERNYFFFWNNIKVVGGCFFQYYLRSWEQFGLCASSWN